MLLFFQLERPLFTRLAEHTFETYEYVATSTTAARWQKPPPQGLDMEVQLPHLITHSFPTTRPVESHCLLPKHKTPTSLPILQLSPLYHPIAYFCVQFLAVPSYFALSVLYMWAISGTNGSSGFGSVNKEQIDSSTCANPTTSNSCQSTPEPFPNSHMHPTYPISQQELTTP